MMVQEIAHDTHYCVISSASGGQCRVLQCLYHPYLLSVVATVYMQEEGEGYDVGVWVIPYDNHALLGCNPFLYVLYFVLYPSHHSDTPLDILHLYILVGALETLAPEDVPLDVEISSPLLPTWHTLEVVADCSMAQVEVYTAHLKTAQASVENHTSA